MIIDSHTHIFNSRIINNREAYLDDNTFKFLYSSDKARMVDHVSMLEAMDESNVDYVVAMGFPWDSEKYCEEQNLYFNEVIKLSGKRIIPFGSVPRNTAKDTEKWVKEIKGMGLAGIGEVAFYAGGMDDKAADFLRELLSSAGSHSLPVCLHVNEPVGHDYPGKYNPGISDLYKILLEYPGIEIILAHWGGGLFFYELMPEINRAFGNIYYDTAASPFLYKEQIYDIAIQIIGPGRILFGSDYPLIKFDRYIKQISGNVNKEENREKILGKNAMRLFKIKE